MLVYKNTKKHDGRPLDENVYGYANETEDYFVHNYCKNGPNLWFGSRVYQKKQGRLLDWVRDIFGAEDILQTQNSAGTVISKVWRPGVGYDQPHKYLGDTNSDFGQHARALTILLQKLSDIFDFTEPSGDGLNAYGHKTRELLILACTEVENYWVHYLKIAGIIQARYSTNDYVRLKSPLHLSEYKVVRDRLNLPDYFPFDGWDIAQPTRSLLWYDSYNKVKHDRNANFSLATVENCINAVSACAVLFSTRFGPDELAGNLTKLSGLINEIFSIELHDPDLKSFYIPVREIEDPGHTRLCQDYDWDNELIMNIQPFRI